MARPSVKEERREQILIAYEQCVARYGVEGATLDKVAEEAGLARPLIRHNIGNREELHALFVDRFIGRTNKDMDVLLAALPSEQSSRTLIEWLFDPQFADTTVVLVAEALIAAAERDPSLAKKMRDWTTTTYQQIRAVFADEFAGAEQATVDAVAAGVMGIYFNVDSLVPLGGLADIRKASKAAAIMLVAQLEGA